MNLAKVVLGNDLFTTSAYLLVRFSIRYRMVAEDGALSIRQRMVKTFYDEAEVLQSGWGVKGGGFGWERRVPRWRREASRRWLSSRWPGGCGVTKGSFYWHFKDRRALLEATLERWEEESTEARISASRRISDPRERLIRLGEEVFGDAPLDGDESGKVLLERGVELAISDAADDAIVRPFLRRVTEHRIGYLEECFRELGLPTEEARYRALL